MIFCISVNIFKEKTTLNQKSKWSNLFILISVITLFEFGLYISNNKVIVKLLLVVLIFAPSVNPWLKNPCCEFLCPFV